MSLATATLLEPLIKRKIFRTEEDAIRELLREYMFRQIADLHQQDADFQQQYGMDFQQFSDYLHERSALLVSGTLSFEQRKTLGRAVMKEEDDWFDWNTAREMLETWLGLQQETGK